jgi:hypothetical protein
MAFGCGRTELDLSGVGTTAVTTGAAGNGGAAGVAGGTTGAADGSFASRPAGAGAGGRAASSPTPIPCGSITCTSGRQICCVAGEGRRSQETCIAAGAICEPEAASIGCVDGSGCGAGDVCCESLLAPTTMCAAPESCLRAPGVILCGADADCPALAPHCCQAQDVGICSGQVCPAGGGGDNGPDEAN